MSVVILENVNKKFVLRHTRSIKEAIVWLFKGRKHDFVEKFQAIDSVDLRISSGESVAFLGLNGSGKSTLLKLISGVILPDSGSVRVQGRVAGLIEVGAGFHSDLSGRDNVYLNGAILGMSEDQIADCFDSIVEFSEIGKFIDTEVKFYSSGMYLRLAFAVAVHTNPEIFLVDEILAVGDEPFQKKCLQKIRELIASGKTLVVVSHDLDMVTKICDRAILVESGRIIYDGKSLDAVAKFRERLSS